MKTLVVYSSLTGNTKMIAQAIHEIMPTDCLLVPVAQAPEPDNYDLIALGFWVDKGAPDKAMLDYMSKVHGKLVGLFGTLGAYPDSEHAQDTIKKAEENLIGNTIIDTFMCQGKIDPKILEMMAKIPEAAQAHPMTAERETRIEEAKKHPNTEDCQAAQKIFSNILAKAKES